MRGLAQSRKAAKSARIDSLGPLLCGFAALRDSFMLSQ